MSGDNSQELVISVAAGKGGTGKTLVATSLALALDELYPGRVQLIDCDVEEPNADILLHPQITSEQPVNILVPEVDLEKCIYCGKCAEACQFSAIAVIRQAVITFPQLCAGCGACSYVCPVEAIAEVPRQVGVLSKGSTEEGIQFVMGRLTVGDQRATPVTKAAKDCVAEGMITILDAPPGTACPMQETIEDSDFCLLVTEPTPFGLANLQDSVETCRRMDIPCGIIINRDGVGDAGVEEYCTAENLPLLLRIPQQRQIAEAYSRGDTLTKALPEWTEPLQGVFAQITNLLTE